MSTVKPAKIKVKLFRAVLAYPDGSRENYETADIKNGPSELVGFCKATGATVEKTETITETYTMQISDVLTYGTPAVVENINQEVTPNE